jgi:hypothetical protein
LKSLTGTPQNPVRKPRSDRSLVELAHSDDEGERSPKHDKSPANLLEVHLHREKKSRTTSARKLALLQAKLHEEECKLLKVPSAKQEVTRKQSLTPLQQRHLDKLQTITAPLTTLKSSDVDGLKLLLSGYWNHRAFKQYVQTLIQNNVQSLVKLHWHVLSNVDQHWSRNRIRQELNSVGLTWGRGGALVKCREMDKDTSLRVRKFRDAVTIEARLNSGDSALLKEGIIVEEIHKGFEATQVRTKKAFKAKGRKKTARARLISKDKHVPVLRHTGITEALELEIPSEQEKYRHQKTSYTPAVLGTFPKSKGWSSSKVTLAQCGDIHPNPGPRKSKETKKLEREERQRQEKLLRIKRETEVAAEEYKNREAKRRLVPEVVAAKKNSVEMLPDMLREGYTEIQTFSWVSGINHLDVKPQSIVTTELLSWMEGGDSDELNETHPKRASNDRMKEYFSSFPLVGGAMSGQVDRVSGAVIMGTKLRRFFSFVPTPSISRVLPIVPAVLGLVNLFRNPYDTDWNRTCEEANNHIEREINKGPYVKPTFESLLPVEDDVGTVYGSGHGRNQEEIDEYEKGCIVWRLTLTPDEHYVPMLDDNGEEIALVAGVEAEKVDVRNAMHRKIDLKCNTAPGKMTLERVIVAPGVQGMMKVQTVIEDRLIDMRGFNMAYRGIDTLKIDKTILLAIAKRNMEFSINTHEQSPEEAADIVWAFTAKAAHKLCRNLSALTALNAPAITLARGGSSAM